jgi:hypothetical protein
MAEREGFEPSIRFNPYDALAKRCFRPLSHLSGCKVERGIKSGEAGGVNGFSADSGRKSPLLADPLSIFTTETTELTERVSGRDRLRELRALRG